MVQANTVLTIPEMKKMKHNRLSIDKSLLGDIVVSIGRKSRNTLVLVTSSFSLSFCLLINVPLKVSIKSKLIMSQC